MLHFLRLIVILSLGAYGACSPQPQGAPASSPPEAAEPPNPTHAPAPPKDSEKPAPAAPKDTPQRPSYKPLTQYKGDVDAPLSYLVVEPPDLPPDAPIVLALHGFGDTAQQFAAIAENLALDMRLIIVEAPLFSGHRDGRAWSSRRAPYDEVLPQLKQLEAMLDHLAKRHPEARHFGVFGFSQGAMMAMQMAAAYPDRVQAAGALSGYLVERAVPTEGPRPPLFISAGARDGVVAEALSWEAAEAFEEAGFEVQRFPYDGPHTVTRPALAALKVFFEKHLSASSD